MFLGWKGSPELFSRAHAASWVLHAAAMLRLLLLRLALPGCVCAPCSGPSLLLPWSFHHAPSLLPEEAPAAAACMRARSCAASQAVACAMWCLPAECIALQEQGTDRPVIKALPAAPNFYSLTNWRLPVSVQIYSSCSSQSCHPLPGL